MQRSVFNKQKKRIFIVKLTLLTLLSRINLVRSEFSHAKGLETKMVQDGYYHKATIIISIGGINL